MNCKKIIKKWIENILDDILEENKQFGRTIQDVLEIITVFAARMYGVRSHKNKKWVEAAKVILNDEQ